jgi:hypothetical protein
MTEPAPIIAPTEDVWRAMSQVERERFLLKVLDSLSDPAAAMSEGRPHKTAETRTLDRPNLHFNAIGRAVYHAEEMAVVYPGEEPSLPTFWQSSTSSSPKTTSGWPGSSPTKGRGSTSRPSLPRGDPRPRGRVRGSGEILRAATASSAMEAIEARA